MSTIKCLVVDDEELARRLVISYCERLPHLEVVGQAANPIEAMQLLKAREVDLLFLDIQMPEMTGTEMLRILRRPPAVVLTTAYSNYALESYDLDVVDYLLKPFSFERFLRAVNKAEDSLRQSPERRQEAPTPATAPLPDIAPAAAPTFQLVKSEHKVFRIPHPDILYVESAREYVIYHTPKGKTMALGSLKKLEEELPANFIRIHKSYIVARDKVEVLEGNMLRVGEKSLPIGASYREKVLEEIFR